MAAAFADIDSYIAALPDDVRPLMQGVRLSIHTVVPEVAETISYAMPTFTLDGKPLVHIAAWKKHIGLYPLPAMEDDLARAVAPYRGTESTMQLKYDSPIPYALVERVVAVLVAARTQTGT